MRATLLAVLLACPAQEKKDLAGQALNEEPSAELHRGGAESLSHPSHPPNLRVSASLRFLRIGCCTDV